MKTYTTSVRIVAEHLDKGNHANWLAQLAIAEKVHFSFRDSLGLGLEELTQKHHIFLVMRDVRYIRYRKQLRLDDIIDVTITMWISRPTSLEFRCLFQKDGKMVMETGWIMPLVSVKNERPVKIPPWMIEAIGLEKPEVSHRVPASTLW